MSKIKNFKFISNGFEPNYNIDFIFLYMPSLKCNQNCYYCDILHNNKDNLTKEKLLIQYKFIKHLEKLTEGRKRGMDLFGGEFLVNIDIFKFMTAFYKNWDKFRLFTHLNYKDLRIFDDLAYEFKKLEYVISIHFHQIKDIEQYICGIHLIRQYGRKITLRIMFDYKQEDKIQRIIDEFYDKYPNVFLEFRPIYGGFKWAKDFYFKIKKEYQHEDFKMIDIKNKKIYKLRDWLDLHISSFMYPCQKASYNEIVLYEYGNVYPCESMALKQKGKILNIYEDDFTKLELKPVKFCPLKECRCEWFFK
jgi:sulfatase maturation enzyme AslB (radical SAM superfamily)